MVANEMSVKQEAEQFTFLPKSTPDKVSWLIIAVLICSRSYADPIAFVSAKTRLVTRDCFGWHAQ